MARKKRGRASEAMTGKGQAREGHDRIMPKKDVTEIGKVGQVSTIVAQRLVLKLSC